MMAWFTDAYIYTQSWWFHEEHMKIYFRMSAFQYLTHWLLGDLRTTLKIKHSDASLEYYMPSIFMKNLLDVN